MCFHYTALSQFTNVPEGISPSTASLNYLTWRVSFELAWNTGLGICGVNSEIFLCWLKMLHLNYRWHWEHCGMTEVRVIGEMEMTHNAARISAATYPEIEAAYFISGCSYSFCFHSTMICLLFSCCAADCVSSFWAARMKNVCCQHSVSPGQW